MAKLNAKGWELYKEWERIYEDELHRLQDEMHDPDFVEGWCIIDDYRFVKTVEDQVGLLVFGYDEGVGAYFDFWTEHGGENEICFTDINGKDYTFAEVEKLVVPYYENYYG